LSVCLTVTVRIPLLPEFVDANLYRRQEGDRAGQDPD
jgi:hypothetical protein